MYLLYHTWRGLSRGFSNFFEVFFLTLGEVLSSFGIFIIAHSVLFVKRFFNFFQEIFLGKSTSHLGSLLTLALLTLLIIADGTPKVKHFRKNKKIIIFAKTLDKNVGVWYNGKFRALRSCARRPNVNPKKYTHD